MCQPPHRRPGGTTLRFYLVMPSDSAVVVVMFACSAHPQRAHPAGRSRPPHHYPGDRPVPQFLVQPAQHRGREQSHLSGPGGGVCDHHKLAVVEPLWPGVRRHIGPDELVPAPEHRADRGRCSPALIAQQGVQGGAQRLRVLPPGAPAAARPALAGNRPPARPLRARDHRLTSHDRVIRYNGITGRCIPIWSRRRTCRPGRPPAPARRVMALRLRVRLRFRKRVRGQPGPALPVSLLRHASRSPPRPRNGRPPAPAGHPVPRRR